MTPVCRPVHAVTALATPREQPCSWIRLEPRHTPPVQHVSSREPDLGAPRRSVALGAAAVVGGLLWIFYGVVEMVAPWGMDAVYNERRGYDVVVNRGLFVIYSLPGALALVVTAASSGCSGSSR